MKPYNYLVALLMSTMALLAYGVSATPANAMIIRGGEDYSLENYTSLEDDLYVGAENSIKLSGTTTGDVFAAAGTEVIADGTISGDALILSGDVSFSGDVEGDLRTAAGNVLLEGHVSEDVIIGGGAVEIRESAVIEGDLFIFADYIDFRGEVHGEVVMYGRLIDIKGDMYSGAEIHVKESLSVMDNAHIEGNLIYKAPRDAFIPDESVVQGEIQATITPTSAMQGRFDWMGAVYSILIAVVSSVALTFFFPHATRQMVATVFEEKPVQVVKGTLLLLFWPMASFFLLFTLVGALPAITLLLAYSVSVMVALALAPVIAGVVLARWFKHGDDELELPWVSFGAVTFSLIVFVPVLGFLTRLLIFLFAFNAVCVLIYTTIWKKRKGDVEQTVAESQTQEEISAPEEGTAKEDNKDDEKSSKD